MCQSHGQVVGSMSICAPVCILDFLRIRVIIIFEHFRVVKLAKLCQESPEPNTEFNVFESGPRISLRYPVMAWP